MTTIACDRQCMAADSLVTVSEQRNYQTTKLWRVAGSIFGAAGDCDAISKFRRWQDEQIEPDFSEGADLSVLELRADGIYLWDTGLYPDRLEDVEQNYAIGGIGAGVALYCMRVLGLHPDRAVAEACRVDTGCGLPVTVMALIESERKCA